MHGCWEGEFVWYDNLPKMLTLIHTLTHSMCVWVCVACVSVACVPLCGWVGVGMGESVSVGLCACACMCACECVRVCVYMCIFVCSWYCVSVLCLCLRLCLCLCLCVCACVPVCVNINMICDRKKRRFRCLKRGGEQLL